MQKNKNKTKIVNLYRIKPLHSKHKKPKEFIRLDTL